MFPGLLRRGVGGRLIGQSKRGAWRILIDGNKYESSWSPAFWERVEDDNPRETRASVLWALRQSGPMTHDELYAKLGLTTLRTHLPRLVDAGVLRVERVPTSPSTRHDKFVYHLATNDLV